MKKIIIGTIVFLLILGGIGAYISYRLDTVEVTIGCNAHNVKVTGTSIPRYMISSYNIFGNNYTRFHVTNDDAPEISFTTDAEGKKVRRFQLDYVSAGTMDDYSIKC